MPSSASIEAYASIIKEKSIMRSVMDAAGKIQAMGFEEQEMGAKEYLDRAEVLIMTVDRAGSQGGFTRAGDGIGSTIQILEDLYAKKRNVTGVPTGFADLDRLTSGLQPSDLIIIAGRPSMGKTSIALNIATYAAMTRTRWASVLWRCPKTQLLTRLLSSESEIDHSKLRAGMLNETEWLKLPPPAVRIKRPLFTSTIRPL